MAAFQHYPKHFRLTAHPAGSNLGHVCQGTVPWPQRFDSGAPRLQARCPKRGVKQCDIAACSCPGGLTEAGEQSVRALGLQVTPSAAAAAVFLRGLLAAIKPSRTNTHPLTTWACPLI